MKEKIENIIVTLTLYKFVDNGQLQLEILRLIYLKHVFLFQPFCPFISIMKMFLVKKRAQTSVLKKNYFISILAILFKEKFWRNGSEHQKMLTVT